MQSVGTFILREAGVIGRNRVPAARGLPVEGMRTFSEVAHHAPDTMLAPIVNGFVDQHVFETLKPRGVNATVVASIATVALDPS